MARLEMWRWLKRRNMIPRGEVAPASTVPQRRRQAGPDQLLFDYLEERYAQTVVLTFQQIEDLLGSGLPEPARRDGAWWHDTEPGTTGVTRRAVAGLEADQAVAPLLDLPEVEAGDALQILERLARCLGAVRDQRRRFAPQQAGNALQLLRRGTIQVERRRGLALEVCGQVFEGGVQLLVGALEAEADHPG